MFLHPLLLWGLPLIAVPLLIHLINLLRHRRIRWGAMEFLLAGFRRHRTWVRMKELLLLLMRMLAVAMIVLAVAQPVLKNKLGGLLAGGGKTHHIVLLDDSFSMMDRLDDKSAFESAKEVVLKLAEESARQPLAQNFTLLRFSQARADDEPVRQEKTEDAQNPEETAQPQSLAKLVPDMHSEPVDGNFKERLQAVLDPLSASDFADAPMTALEAVEQLVPRAADEKRIVYLVTDFRKRQWHENADLKKLLTELEKSDVSLRLVDCADAEHPNLAVTALYPAEGTRVAGVPLVMYVEVTNFGTAAAKNVVVHPETAAGRAGISPTVTESAADEKDAEKKPAANSAGSQSLLAVTIHEIPPGETVREPFLVNFASPGMHAIRVKLDTDAIMADNARACVVDFPANESVLVIDGDAAAADGKALMLALAPGGNVNTGVVPRLELPRFLSTNPLAGYHAIYLLNVGTLDPQALHSLEEYIKNGGGVAVFVGPKTEPAAALTWYRDGTGFFPVKLRQQAELRLDTLEKVPDLRVSNHSIFRIFAGRDSGLLSTVNVSRYYALEDESLEQLIPQDDLGTAKNTPGAAAADGAPGAAAGGEKPVQTDDVRRDYQDTQVIASLRNNDPLVLERRYGDGRVVVFLTTAGPEWNNWARGNPSYVVAMLQLQARLASRKDVNSLTVGEPLAMMFNPEDYQPEAQFISPTGENLGVVNGVPQPDGMFWAPGPRTETGGIYTAKLVPRGNKAETQPLAVNVDPREGDTHRVTSETLAESMKGVPYVFYRAAEFYLSDTDGGGMNISDLILYVLIIWLILEMLLAASASYHIPAGSLHGGTEITRKHSGTSRIGGAK